MSISVESGFSVQKEQLENNLKEETMVAKRRIYDFVGTQKISGFVTDEMIKDKSRSGSPESVGESSYSVDDGFDVKKKTVSPGKSRSRSLTRSSSPSRSRSRSSDKHRRYRSKSHSYDRRYRSRSRSPYGRSRYNGRDKSRHERKRCRDSRSDSRSRSPMSGRRRHLADRENPPKSRCLGVFGLSLHTRERDLYDVFSRYGDVEDIQLVYDNHSGRSRGFCFIYFATSEDAGEAKDRAHGMELDGRNIRCDFSITERAHTPTPGVYLGKPSRRRSPRSPSRYRSRYSRSRSKSYDRHDRRY